MYLKYLALPLSLALAAGSAHADQTCPSAQDTKSAPVGTMQSGYVPVHTSYAGSNGSVGAAVATVALVGVVGYLVLKHEHDKQVAAQAAACAAAQPAPTTYVLAPPADPTASMTIDGIVYSPPAKALKAPETPQASPAPTATVASNP